MLFAGFFESAYWSGSELPVSYPVPFGFSAYSLISLIHLTTIQSHPQAEALLMGTLLDGYRIRLPVEPPFIPALRIGRVGENTSPYLSPLRTGLDSYPIIRLKPLALQNVCLCVRVCDTLYVGGLNYRFCLCHRLSPLFCDGCAVPLH